MFRRRQEMYFPEMHDVVENIITVLGVSPNSETRQDLIEVLVDFGAESYEKGDKDARDDVVGLLRSYRTK